MHTSPPTVPLDLGRTPSGAATTVGSGARSARPIPRGSGRGQADLHGLTRRQLQQEPGRLGQHGRSVVCTDRIDWFAADPDTVLQGRERSTGQHIELGKAETNLVGLMAELGATWSRWSQPLLPISAMYDPFVCRALEPWTLGMYAGGQSILVGTFSGVTLASEGGAPQSIITPSIGLEQPGCASWEPAFAPWMPNDACSRRWRSSADPTGVGLPSALHPSGRPGPRRNSWTRRRESIAASTSSLAATAWWAVPHRSRRLRRWAPLCRRRCRRPSASPVWVLPPRECVGDLGGQLHVGQLPQRGLRGRTHCITGLGQPGHRGRAQQRGHTIKLRPGSDISRACKTLRHNSFQELCATDRDPRRRLRPTCRPSLGSSRGQARPALDSADRIGVRRALPRRSFHRRPTTRLSRPLLPAAAFSTHNPAAPALFRDRLSNSATASHRPSRGPNTANA